MHKFESISLVVLDGVGVGPAHDTADLYPEDIGSNSLRNASAEGEPLDSYALQSMGVSQIPGMEGLRVQREISSNRIHGAFGALEPTFAGNGSPEGHQSLAGLVTVDPYDVFNKTGIPDALVSDIENVVANLIKRQVQVVRYPGTDDINGIKFISHPDIGAAHLASKDPTSGPLKLPVYASSDSLVQLAIHQGVLPQEMIEAIGKAVRESLDDKNRRVARVIMRPFIGEPGSFTRVSGDRRDYAMNPDGPTLIDYLTEAGVPVFGIGKTASLFNGQGFPEGSVAKLHNDDERAKATLDRILDGKHGLTFTNLVATDELHGHTRQAREYMQHINRMGSIIDDMLACMGENQLLIITSDHGNDPTQTKHTNHTRERAPLLVASGRIKRPIELGVRGSYADVAATIAENFGIQNKLAVGQSFLRELTG